MNVIIMIDMIIIEDIGNEKEIGSIDNIVIIETIAGIAKDIEIIETTETGIDKEKEIDKEIDKEIEIEETEIEIDITKIIKAEILLYLLPILAICPIIVLALLVRLGLHDSSLYECLWTSWRALPFWF